MIAHELLRDRGILIVTPQGPLASSAPSGVSSAVEATDAEVLPESTRLVLLLDELGPEDRRGALEQRIGLPDRLLPRRPRASIAERSLTRSFAVF